MLVDTFFLSLLIEAMRRDTLEQIDAARGVIDKYADTFQLALTASDVETAIRSGKIASLLGVEG